MWLPERSQTKHLFYFPIFLNFFCCQVLGSPQTVTEMFILSLKCLFSQSCIPLGHTLGLPAPPQKNTNEEIIPLGENTFLPEIAPLHRLIGFPDFPEPIHFDRFRKLGWEHRQRTYTWLSSEHNWGAYVSWTRPPVGSLEPLKRGQRLQWQSDFWCFLIIDCTIVCETSFFRRQSSGV